MSPRIHKESCCRSKNKVSWALRALLGLWFHILFLVYSKFRSFSALQRRYHRRRVDKFINKHVKVRLYHELEHHTKNSTHHASSAQNRSLYLTISLQRSNHGCGSTCPRSHRGRPHTELHVRGTRASDRIPSRNALHARPG